MFLLINMSNLAVRYAYPVSAGAAALYLFPQLSNVANYHVPGYIVVALLYLASVVGILSSLNAGVARDALHLHHTAIAGDNSEGPTVSLLTGVATLAYVLSMLIGARLSWWLPLAAVTAASGLSAGITLHWRFSMRQKGMSSADADVAGLALAQASGLQWGLPALFVAALAAFH